MVLAINGPIPDNALDNWRGGLSRQHGFVHKCGQFVRKG
jgi:hypothetical protein